MNEEVKKISKKEKKRLEEIRKKEEKMDKMKKDLQKERETFEKSVVYIIDDGKWKKWKNGRPSSGFDGLRFIRKVKVSEKEKKKIEKTKQNFVVYLLCVLSM